MITSLVPYWEQLHNGNAQYCDILAISKNGAQLRLSETDIRQGGFNYDARSASGETLEVGSTIAAQLTLNPFTTNAIESFAWEGATLYVSVGVESDSAVVYGSLGAFVVDTAERKYDLWTIIALDNLVRFDKALTADDWEYFALDTHTIGDIISKACDVCGVAEGTIADLVNTSATMPAIAEQGSVTWRTVLQWCGEVGCVCFYCDGTGKLCCKWYSTSAASDENWITASDRYNFDLSSNDIALTGAKVLIDSDNGERVEFSYGTNVYSLTIENNPFYTEGNGQSLINAVGEAVADLYYAPFSANTVPFIYISPMDEIGVSESGDSPPLDTIVTHVAFTLNGNCSIEAVGKSTQNMSYASSSAFTRQQAATFSGIKREIENYVNARETALMQLNRVMANSLGLELYVDNGIYYFYDAVKVNGEGGTRQIENANIIYTFRSGGLAWTKADGTRSAWQRAQANDWNYGIDEDGNAYLNQISTTGISVAKVDSDFETQITPERWELLHKGKALIEASGSTGEGILTLDKVQMTDNGYIRMGKARMYGTSTGMDIVIED